MTAARCNRRWLYLPPGSFIDASRPDAWEFPRGTRVWKEFSYGRPVETRYIERRADGSWLEPVGDTVQRHDTEPHVTWLARLRLGLLSMFVSEDQL